MQKLTTILWAAYFFGTSAFFCTVVGIICLLTAPFDPNRKAAHLFASFWGMFYLYTNPWWKTTFVGRELIEPGKTYVLVANHQSYWDILVLYGLYKPFKFVSKESIFKMPFVGQNMVFNQYVKIKRGDLKSIKEMMNTCKGWLKQGSSILLFPEGTRSEDGEIKNFRDGAFRMAVDCGVPVVPVVIDGTHEILGKQSKAIGFRSDITIKVLPPVHPEEFDGSSGLMRKHVHQIMQDNLKEIRESKIAIEDHERAPLLKNGNRE